MTADAEPTVGWSLVKRRNDSSYEIPACGLFSTYFSWHSRLSAATDVPVRRPMRPRHVEDRLSQNERRGRKLGDRAPDPGRRSTSAAAEALNWPRLSRPALRRARHVPGAADDTNPDPASCRTATRARGWNRLKPSPPAILPRGGRGLRCPAGGEGAGRAQKPFSTRVKAVGASRTHAVAGSARRVSETWSTAVRSPPRPRPTGRGCGAAACGRRGRMRPYRGGGRPGRRGRRSPWRDGGPLPRTWVGQ